MYDVHMYTRHIMGPPPAGADDLISRPACMQCSLQGMQQPPSWSRYFSKKIILFDGNINQFLLYTCWFLISYLKRSISRIYYIPGSCYISELSWNSGTSWYHMNQLILDIYISIYLRVTRVPRYNRGHRTLAKSGYICTVPVWYNEFMHAIYL